MSSQVLDTAARLLGGLDDAGDHAPAVLAGLRQLFETLHDALPGLAPGVWGAFAPALFATLRDTGPAESRETASG